MSHPLPCPLVPPLRPFPQPVAATVLAWILGTMGLASTAVQGETNRVTLTLEQALTRAAAMTLDVRLADEQIASAEGKLREERSDVLPSVQAILAQRRQDRSQAAFGLPQEATLNLSDTVSTDISYPGVSSDLVNALNLPRQTVTVVDEELDLDLSFPASTGPRDFVNGKVLLAAPLVNVSEYRELTSAHRNLARSRHQLQATQESARREAATLYTRLQFLAETIRTLQAVITLKDSRATMLMDLAAADVAREIDARNARLEVLKSRSELALMRDHLRTALGGIKRHLAYPAGTRVRLGSRLQFRPLDPAAFRAAPDEALSSRPDLLELRERESMATTQLQATEAGRYPTVHLVGYVGPEGETYDDTVTGWYVGFLASVPLWDFRGRRGEIEQAESRARQTRYQVQDLEQGIATSLVGLPEALRLRHESVLIGRETVDLAREKVALQEDRQRAGTGRPLEVLAAEVELREAELSHLQAVYAYELLAIEWFYAIGRCDRIAGARGEGASTEASSTL